MISFKRIKLDQPNPALSLCLFVLIYVGVFYSAQLLKLPFTAQIIVNPLVFSLAPSFLFMWYYQLPIKQTLQLRPVDFKTLVSSLAIACCVVLVMIPFASLIPIPEELLKSLKELLGTNPTRSQYLLRLLGIGVLAGIGEEIAFRGIILRGFLSVFPAFFSVVVTSLMFGLSHFDLVRFIPTFMIGIFLGMVAIRSGLIPCILIHVIYNSTLVTMDYFKLNVLVFEKPLYNVAYYILLLSVLFVAYRFLRRIC
jgi:membrane protease YdiL (CAAX protease family)